MRAAVSRIFALTRRSAKLEVRNRGVLLPAALDELELLPKPPAKIKEFAGGDRRRPGPPSAPNSGPPAPGWEGSLGLFGGRFLLGFHRLAEAVTFAVHLEDVALVRQAVQQSRGHPFPLEDLVPFAERQLAGDQQAAASVAVGEDLEEQLGSGSAERQVAQFDDDQEVDAFQVRQQSIEAVLLLGLLQERDQLCGRDELHAFADPAEGRERRDRRQMGRSACRLLRLCAAPSRLPPFAHASGSRGSENRLLGKVSVSPSIPWRTETRPEWSRRG